MKLIYKGFTLIELLITIALAGIVLTLGVPSLMDYIAESRTQSAVLKLNHSLLFARNYAVTHKVRVVVCHLDSSGNCDGEWHRTLSIFTDLNSDNVYQAASEDLLQELQGHTGGDLSLLSNNNNQVVFNTRGRTTPGSFYYCATSDTNELFVEGIVIAASGRVRPAYDNNGDGKDDDNGNEITCSS